MTKLNERVRQARTELHLSQDYVARFLGIGRSAVAEIESNKRKISAEELGKLSDLFLIPADELLNGKKIDMPAQVFARSFESLGESDQQEILNLMKFKQAMKERQ
ncbi:MAG: helix-turn-helix transcriptional regulator [Gordonibacter sp.]|uniref:helix-turn-helix domain-containing protein n=1 Tax=Gordonibacter sp. TaxID=1968902 RepID=UPI002B37ABD0|nr:helix-turn-helix transcriptional regulator [Gordonibacter sp.]